MRDGAFISAIGSSGRAFDSRSAPAASELRVMYSRAAAHWHATAKLSGYPRAYAQLFADLRREGWFDGLPDALAVLDCGIGTGMLSLGLARALRIHSLSAVDLSVTMATEAVRHLSNVGVSLDLRIHDARQLPWRDASFDLVMSAHVLEHMADPWTAIREMHRVVRPGGVILAVVTRDNLADPLVRARWPYDPIQGRVLAAWMRGVGLEGVRRFRVGSRLCVAHWLSHAFLAWRPLVDGPEAASAC